MREWPLPAKVAAVASRLVLVRAPTQKLPMAALVLAVAEAAAVVAAAAAAVAVAGRPHCQ